MRIQPLRKLRHGRRRVIHRILRQDENFAGWRDREIGGGGETRVEGTVGGQVEEEEAEEEEGREGDGRCGGDGDGAAALGVGKE